MENLIFNEDAYTGEHESPDPDNGSPLYNLIGMYPADIYGPMGCPYYAGDAREAFYLAMGYKGRPNRTITVYRSVPKSLIRPKINPGDWVTTVRSYAKEHGESNLNNDFKIIKKTVYARDLYTEGNSLEEWGYYPQPYIPFDKEEEIRTSLGMRTKTEIRAERAALKPPEPTTESINIDLFLEGIDQKHTGYKVMTYDETKNLAVSTANNNYSFPLQIGKIISMPGAGIYMSTDKNFVLTYYSGLADSEVLVVFDFNSKDILKGNVNDKENEITVRKATITSFKVL